jgi:hypothetical protein
MRSNSRQNRFGPRRRMIEPSVVRIRSCTPDLIPRGMRRPGGERVALASAGRALVELRGFAEDQVGKVAPYWFGAPGKPFRRRSGVPFRTAGQEPSLLTSPLSTSRAPSGHVPKGRRRSIVGRHHPPRLPAPSAHAAPRIRSTRACQARHLPSSAFRTLSTAYTPRRLPSLFHPGDAHGVRVFRVLLLTGAPGPLSRPRALLPFEPDLRTPLSAGRVRDCRALSSPESPYRGWPKPPRGRYPPDLCPFRALPVSAVGSDPLERLALRA